MKSIFGGLLASIVLIASPGLAQDGESPAEDPGAATVPDVEPAAESRAEEIDELEPGVPTQVLVSDVEPRSSGVMDELDLGSIEITGNQELPTVLYIVPWQQSDPGDLMGRTANTLLDEVLAPVDRGEFVRQVDYYDDLFSPKEE